MPAMPGSLLTTTFAVLFLVSCQSKPSAEPENSKSSVADEVSLKADRSQYDDLRKDVPENIRRENDELAFVRGLMAQGDEEPSKIRDRFAKAVRDRREKFDRTQNRIRDDYSKREKKAREEFLKKLKNEREEFSRTAKAKKYSQERRKEFFDDQDAHRQDFFNDEKDARKTYESEVIDQRKAFEAYITEKTNQFNQELRDYTATYNERRKALDLKKKTQEKSKRKHEKVEKDPDDEAPTEKAPLRTGDPDLDEFRAIPPVPSTPLGPDQNN